MGPLNGGSRQARTSIQAREIETPSGDQYSVKIGAMSQERVSWKTRKISAR